MKKLVFPALFVLAIAITSCSANPCKDGYTEVDGACLPDYIVGIEKMVEANQQVHHPELGIVVYKEGNWYYLDDSLATPLNK